MPQSFPILTVASSGNLGVQASVVIQNVTYTAIDAGTGGNSITVAYVNDGTGGAETVTVSGSDMTVHMETGVSTASNIVTAINADSSSNVLVSAVRTGTNSTQTAVGATSLTGGTTIVNYNSVNISNRLAYSIQAIFTGSTPVGTFKLQATNFPNDSTSWNDISGTSHAITDVGNFIWSIVPAFYNHVRLVYTATSGSGTVNATLASKE